MPTRTQTKASGAPQRPRANGVVIGPVTHEFAGPMSREECLLPVYRRLLAPRPAETETQQEAA